MSAARRQEARLLVEDDDGTDAAAAPAPAVIVVNGERGTPGFADDVRRGLTRDGQKELYSKYLYDAVGSELFEAITRVDAYGLTNADERILRDNADGIVRASRPPVVVAELGSGSGRKVRPLLESFARTGATCYAPIDISKQAIARCRTELGRIAGIRFSGIVGEYLGGLRKASSLRPPDGRILVLFVGSSIGNFDRGPAQEFLRAIRGVIEPGDALLLGTDLVKPESMLIPAYDDPAGVTAAFNRNLLVRINRELSADFDLAEWAHEVRWNEAERRIEMHLRSMKAQRVHVADANLTVTFQAGETIWTESSHKFLPAEPVAMGKEAGFDCAGQWIDRAWPFAETLLVAT